MTGRSTRGVQQEEVTAAADALLAERVRPTIERVRLKLGRGSPNTVAPMLEQWFAGLAPRLGVAPEGATTGVEHVPATVRQALDTVWALAVEVARRQAEADLELERGAVASQHDELQQVREDLERQRMARERHETALSEALVLAKGQVVDQAARIQRLEAELLRSGQELASNRASLASMVEERDAERRRHDERLQTLSQEQQRSAERTAANERHLLGEIDRARSETKEVRAALAETERVQTAALAAGQRHMEELRARAHTSEVELAAMRERSTAAELRADALVKQMEQEMTRASAPLRAIKVVSASKQKKAKSPGARAGRAAVPQERSRPGHK
jgi:chromosome segregation ATPase